MLLKNFWVLVFSFMYLVSVDPMDRSYEYVVKTLNNCQIMKREGWAELTVSDKGTR